MTRQYYAGQYIYRDYAKLREAIRNRQLQKQFQQEDTTSPSSHTCSNNTTSSNGINYSIRNYHTLTTGGTTKGIMNKTNTTTTTTTNIFNNNILTSSLPSISTPTHTPILSHSFFTSSIFSPFSSSSSSSFKSSTEPSFLQSLKLKTFEKQANENPNNPNIQYTFLSELIQYYPLSVCDRIINYNQFCIDDRIALLYFQALNNVVGNRSGGSTGGISGGGIKFNLDSFMKRLNNKSNMGNILIDPLKLIALNELQSEYKSKGVGNGGGSGSASSKATKEYELLSKVIHILSGVGAGLGSSTGVASNAMLGAAGATNTLGTYPLPGSIAGGIVPLGTDPKYPLHVQMQSGTSARMALFNLTKQVLIAFIVVSAISAALDEKGIGGRAMGAINGSKHVKEAEGSDVRFDDVKGVDEAKAELEEIVEYLKNPDKFTRLGGKLPRGLLLTGPPGTGKTLLAKAIAGEAGVPFFFSSGSQFEEVYVGLGAKRVRELFEAAKKKSPAIIFIDEIDAVGGTRKLKDQSALKMTLNELLVQMDGFDENNGVIVIGATNFAESLDSALLRPGRFDKQVSVPLPDVGGRKEILEMYSKKTKLAKDVDLSVLARGTIGFSGADLFNLMNQAALKASVEGLNSITMNVLEYAKDKIMMGAERKTAVITPKTAKVTAFHEAGHALVAALTDGAQPIHKATIMPRGQALGMVMLLPEGDQTSQSFKEMLAFMDVAMGGRVAEELIFGDENITSGAMSDIANATKTARAMVTKYGFSNEVGIVYHGGSTGEESASGETRAKIDAEVKRLSEQSYHRAKELLKKHTKEHHLLAETLLEYETLTGDEVRDIILKGKKPNRPITNKEGGARGDRSVLNEPPSSSSSKSKFPGLRGKVAGSRRDDASKTTEA